MFTVSERDTCNTCLGARQRLLVLEKCVEFSPSLGLNWQILCDSTMTDSGCSRCYDLAESVPHILGHCSSIMKLKCLLPSVFEDHSRSYIQIVKTEKTYSHLLIIIKTNERFVVFYIELFAVL